MVSDVVPNYTPALAAIGRCSAGVRRGLNERLNVTGRDVLNMSIDILGIKDLSQNL